MTKERKEELATLAMHHGMEPGDPASQEVGNALMEALGEIERLEEELRVAHAFSFYPPR